MKIYLLTSSIREGYGGWARYSLEVFKELQKHPGLEVIAVTEDNSGQQKIKPVRSGFWLIGDLLANVWSVRQITKNGDLIHALDGYPYGLIAYLTVWGRKKSKFFITAIGTYTTTPLTNPYRGWLSRLAYKKAEKIFAISNFTANKLKALLPLDNVEVVYLGVNRDLLAATPLPAEEINLPKNFILSVGDLKPRKGYHIAIPAFANVSRNYPELHYVIVGYQFNRDYFNQLQSLVAENNLTDKVIFLAAISDRQLAALYRRAKVLILPSLNDNRHYEGFGLVHLEAGLFGIPSIGSQNCGAEDAILDGRTGYLVESGNIELLARQMERLLADENQRQKMGAAAQEFANNFSWSQTVDTYLKHYGAR